MPLCLVFSLLFVFNRMAINIGKNVSSVEYVLRNKGLMIGDVVYVTLLLRSGSGELLKIFGARGYEFTGIRIRTQRSEIGLISERGIFSLNEKENLP